MGRRCPANGNSRLWNLTNPADSPPQTAIRTPRTRPPQLRLLRASRSGRWSSSQPSWPSLSVSLSAWRGVANAATTTRPTGSDAVAMVSFSNSGSPGVVRPAQPADTSPVPVLTDPAMAASAGPDGRIALTVDGLPAIVRVRGGRPLLPPRLARRLGWLRHRRRGDAGGGAGRAVPRSRPQFRTRPDQHRAASTGWVPCSEAGR